MQQITILAIIIILGIISGSIIYLYRNKKLTKKMLAIGAGLLIIAAGIPILLDYPGPPVTYYVATTGSDTTGDGSLGNPYRTLWRAVNATAGSDGDDILLRAGTYTGRTLIKWHNGSSSDYLTIQPYPGESVILQSNSIEMADDNGTIFIRNSSHIRITGAGGSLTIRNSRCYGITVRYPNCHWIQIDNCTFTNMSASAIYVYRNGWPTWVENITVDNCTVSDVNNNNAGYNSQEGISFSGVKNFNIKSNTVSLCGKESIDMKSGSNNGTCHDNRVNCTPKKHNTTWYDVVGIYASGSGTGTSGYVSDINISNNYVWGNRSGITVSGETGATSRNISVFNNVINMTCRFSDSTGNGIAFAQNAGNSPTWDLNIFSNTIFCKYYYNRGIYSGESTSSYIHRVNFSNNIIVGYGYYTVYLGCSNATYAHYNNLYYRYNGTTRTHYSDGDNKWDSSYWKTNPLFVNKNTYDFHINSTSPAIGNATSIYSHVPAYDMDKNTRPQNTTYDIGAYEYLYPSSGLSTSTVRTNGVDYFVWMGMNTSAYHVKYNITGLNEPTEYVAYLNHSGNWTYYYGDNTGNNHTFHTYDIVRTYMNDAAGTITFQVSNNTNIDYDAYAAARTVTLTWVNNGYNYTAYTRSAGTTLSTINSTLALTDGYAVAVWDQSTYIWHWWISGFSVINYNVDQYDVILTKIPSTKTWVQ